MKRRGFLKGLAALCAAPVALVALPKADMPVPVVMPSEGTLKVGDVITVRGVNGTNALHYTITATVSES